MVSFIQATCPWATLVGKQVGLATHAAPSRMIAELVEGERSTLKPNSVKKALKKGGVGSEERADHKKTAFSKDLKEMTKRFINHYMKQELLDEGLHPATDQSRFIFGHTHKPFLEELENVGADFGEIKVANSGGWVIESDKHLPNYGPGIVFGSNNGDMALVKYELNVKPDSEIKEQPKDWKNILEGLAEHEKLEKAISNAVEVRWRYFKKRVQRTKKTLKGLSK